jgi:hypothetical protein
MRGFVSLYTPRGKGRDGGKGLGCAEGRRVGVWTEV